MNSRQAETVSELLQQVEIIRVGSQTAAADTDVVVPEYALHLSVNGRALATLMCLPEALQELITGFLISEGLIRSVESIESITISHAAGEAAVSLTSEAELPLQLYGKRTIHTGCGSPSLFPRTLDSLRSRTVPASTPLPVSSLFTAMRRFQHSSSLFGRTGGVHSAAIYFGGSIRFFREDVGRHNAVDKVAGEAAINKVPGSECALLSSGRISSDLVTKAAIHGIPIVASRSAPTGRAVEIARSLHIGLAGFVRGRRMNIYSGVERFDTTFEREDEP